MAGGEQMDALVRRHGGVVSRAEAAAAGVSRHAVQWGLKTGVLHAVRRGVYTTGPIWRRATPRLRHRLEVLAQQRVHPQLVACSTSAAVVLRLPTPQGPPAQPQLTAARSPGDGGRGGRGRRGGQVARRALLTDAEVWTLRSGIRVTSAVRTVLDCARVWDRLWALALADAAISKWGIDPAELVQAAEARAPVPGRRQMQWVADHARARVESPLESLARGIVVLAELPEPRPQVWIRTRAGSFRVDLLDDTNKVIIEADGKIKYATAEDVWQEKLREDALRDAGYEVVRFTHADFHRQPEWLATYRRAVRRSRRRPGSAPVEPVDPG